jgi:hypothetical protein
VNIREIVELAREAISEEPYAEVVVPFGETVWMMNSVQLEKFWALIAVHEREQCAKIVEENNLNLITNCLDGYAIANLIRMHNG